MKRVDLTEGKVWRVLFALALPIMGGSVLQFAYNLIDMLWVGRLGSNALASIGSASFFIGLGYSINALVVIGTGIKVAHAIGRKDEYEIKQYINVGILLNGIIGVLYGAVLIIGGKYFIQFLHLQDIGVEKGAYLYLAWHAPVLFFAFFNLLYTRIFGSFGDNKSALKISAMGILINIILDPILIYGMKWGVVGAAIATLSANVIMFIVFMMKSRRLFKYDREIGIDKNKFKEVVKLGFPMAFQRILFTLVNIILARMIAVFGPDAIAAQKVGLQIESITYMVIGGLNGALASFVGQNFGANKQGRIRKGYETALGIGIGYSLLTAIVFMVIPRTLVELFVREENTIAIASYYLQIIAVSQIFSAIEMVSNGLFTGIGLPKVPATVSIAFTVLRIPMAFVLMRMLGVAGIWWSIALSSILKGLTMYIMYRLKVRKRYEDVK